MELLNSNFEIQYLITILFKEEFKVLIKVNRYFQFLLQLLASTEKISLKPILSIRESRIVFLKGQERRPKLHLFNEPTSFVDTLEILLHLKF